MTKPVLLVSGFLGAGKTTFINRLLAWSPGRKLGIILNEIGDAGVETSLVRTNAGTLRELAAGCLCCAGPEDLGKAFSALQRAVPDLDGFVVEASGLTHPGPVIRSLIEQGEEWEVEYLGHLSLAPAEGLEDLEKEHLLPRLQLALGDLIILTKTEDLSQEDLRKASDRASALAPGVPVENPGRVPGWDELCRKLAGTLRSPGEAREASPFEESLAGRVHGLDSWVYRSGRPLDARKLGKVLEDLAGNLVRVKGYLNLDLPGSRKWKYLYQQTGKLRHLGSRRWEKREEKSSALVFYGRSLEVERMGELLRSCEIPAQEVSREE